MSTNRLGPGRFCALLCVVCLVVLVIMSLDCSRKNTPLKTLALAGKRGDVMTVRETLRKEPSLVRVRLNKNVTLLHMSVSMWDDAVTIALLDAGADVNARASDGATPLVYAAFADKYSTVALLLRRGASPNIADSQGALPLWAVLVPPGDFETVRLLVEHGADVNASFKGQKMIDVARDPEIVVYLRHHGAK